MSTYWFYQCHSHIPVIESDEGINHGEEALFRLLEAWKNGELPKETDLGQSVEISVTVWDKTDPFRFLLRHPECDIRIVSEYGDHYRRNVATGEPEIHKGKRWP